LQSHRPAQDLRRIGHRENRLEPEAETSDLVTAFSAQVRHGDSGQPALRERPPGVCAVQGLGVEVEDDLDLPSAGLLCISA